MARQQRSMRRISISLRLPLLFLASFLVIIAFVVILVYFRFEKRLTEDYTKMGASVTTLMAEEYDPDKTRLYIEENFALEEYPPSGTGLFS